jgi:SAM-dependent methyltransferase
MSQSPNPSPAPGLASRTVHWDSVYQRKSATGGSWYQADPEPSLSWIRRLAPARTSPILDIGGGASVLVDRLLDSGFSHLTVVDVSAVAVDLARARLGPRAADVRWIVSDVLELGDIADIAIWHDRAVFHFLTSPSDRARYVELAARTIAPGGRLLVATFAIDGPASCSGLPVERYDDRALARVFAPHFEAETSLRSIHTTPSGALQPFTFLQLVRSGADFASGTG